uniref:RING-type E3 ubiquitin transferase n=1 Tax=Amazona collaria TaxID=241587 RepID=A0A8B9FPG2_9PSIT
MELETRCPICLDSLEDASYVMPCLHQFCYTCILQWAESKPECPLCKWRVSSIVHSCCFLPLFLVPYGHWGWPLVTGGAAVQQGKRPWKFNQVKCKVLRLG